MKLKDNIVFVRVAKLVSAAILLSVLPLYSANATEVTTLTSATINKTVGDGSSLSVNVTSGGGTSEVAATVLTREDTVPLSKLSVTVSGTSGGAGNTYALIVTSETGITTGSFAAYSYKEVSAGSASTFTIRDLNGLGAATAGNGGVTVSTDPDTIPATTTGTTWYVMARKATPDDAELGKFDSTSDVLITLTVRKTVASAVEATLDTASTTLAGRVNNLITITPTGDLTSTTPSTANHNVLRIAASITEQPALSAEYPSIAATSISAGSSLVFGDSGITVGSTSISTSTSDIATASRAASINYSGYGNQTVAGSDLSLATVTFTPSRVGTYKVIVWIESATSDAAQLSGTESYQTFTINVSAGVSTIELTPVNATTVEDATYGSLIKVTIKDSAGNAAALAAGEGISLDPTGSAVVKYKYAGVLGAQASAGSVAGAAYLLTDTDFVGGVAYVNLTNATAETSTLVATSTTSASVTTSTAITFGTRAGIVGTVAPLSTSTGWVGSASSITTPQTSSITWKLSSGSSTLGKFAVTVIDTDGKVTGKTGGYYDQSLGAAGSFTVAATFSATSGQAYSVQNNLIAAGTYDATTLNTATVAARNINATANANIDDTVAVSNSSLRVAPAGTASFSVTVSDQFGDALPNSTVVMSWAGRNTSTAATQKTGLTDADGNVTLSYTDTATSTVTATADTVTFTASYPGSSDSTSTATVSWLATTVGTLTLTSTGDTDVIAGTTKTDISAAATGATGTSATASALVKDANGVILVGVPVTFTVAGLTGAEVHTTKATVYTDSTGTAVSNISSYAAGMATVTATAGTVTATDDVYFSQQTITEARTISATVSGGTVTATVKDRYGNPIEGVTVNATRTGTGFFGSGASTSTGTTDKNGVVEFIVSGDATVTVAFSTVTYGQSADAADKVGTTAVTASAAGTALVNQAGLGASLAPAGVNSASVTVVGAPNAAAVAAEAASDAAAEAIDAANAATDAANLAAEASDAATVAAEEARDAADAATAAVEELATQVATLMAALKAQITTLANTVAKIAKKVKA